ncbi:putative nucleotidyltransferase substrate binding domain-containing protein [Sulfurospirillum sp. 1612]|uniref:putative nucleotidyltransferase substrate binding domain-containing protein n=1 Tax=Sulfurospirillum sp. 1612 TaxID=3094835 RepID=UPI002F927226
MSLLDQKSFLKSIHPFEILSHDQIEQTLSSMNIGYYTQDTVLISKNTASNFLYIIVKGKVGEYHDGELIKVYSNSNIFDADSLIDGKTEETFSVLEELICFELDKKTFLNLLEQNQEFKDFFIQGFANKIQSAKQKEYTTQFSSFMLAKVRDTYTHTPCIVDADMPIMSALKKMVKTKNKCIIVKNGSNYRYGIVTDSTIRKYVIFNDYDKFAPIGPIAIHPIITIEYDDYLSNALLLLTKNSIKRLAVCDGDVVIGVLEQLDLLSYFANHSHLVSMQIDKAKNFEELKMASEDLINIIKKLHDKGTKVEYISQLISELNEKIHKKLYDMIMPKHLADKAALIVMGSEGRKEQILKTDQDNALIIDDFENEKDFEPYMMALNEALLGIGFPRCEGNIMVSNPYWRKHAKAYVAEIDRWLEAPSGDDYMHMAIFFDSICVAGDATLLEKLKATIFKKLENKDVIMANFAKAALIFETPIGIFSNLKTENNQVDVKKGGIFPIVQGIRSLALEYKIPMTNTIERIQALVKLDVIDEKYASSLIEAFDTLINLRLKQRLKNSAFEEENKSNIININELNQLELDLLKDSFKIVNKFKKTIAFHFKTDRVS